MAARGGGAKSVGALPNLRSFGPKNSHFSPKTALVRVQNSQTKANGRYTPGATRLSRDQGTFGALQLYDMSEKWPKKAPKSPKNGAMCTSTPKPRTGRILGYVAQKRIPRAPSPPATPHFLWFPSLEIADETRRPPYQRSLGAAGGPASPRTMGANGGSTRFPGAKKMIFSKIVPRPLGMLKQVFLGRFEPVVARFGPWKIPKCLENGPFGDQQWVKNGSKTHFSKNDTGPFMMLKQVVLAHFEPVVTCFGSWKIPKCLKMGHFGTKKGSKMGQKRIFPKVIPDHLGCSNKCF